MVLGSIAMLLSDLVVDLMRMVEARAHADSRAMRPSIHLDLLSHDASLRLQHVITRTCDQCRQWPFAHLMSDVCDRVFAAPSLLDSDQICS